MPPPLSLAALRFGGRPPYPSAGAAYAPKRSGRDGGGPLAELVDPDTLLDAIQRRDPAAVGALYDRVGGRAFGLAYRILGETPAAEDAVQEAFLTLWRQADRLDRARGRLTSYLLTVVHHKAIDLARARSGRAARNLPLEPELITIVTDDLARDVLASLDADAVQGCLAQLPDDQRHPIELAYFEGLTHVEIAAELGIPLGTVKSRLRLGLAKMRTQLEGAGYP